MPRTEGKGFLALLNEDSEYAYDPTAIGSDLAGDRSCSAPLRAGLRLRHSRVVRAWCDIR